MALAQQGNVAGGHEIRGHEVGDLLGCARQGIKGACMVLVKKVV